MIFKIRLHFSMNLKNLLVHEELYYYYLDVKVEAGG